MDRRFWGLGCLILALGWGLGCASGDPRRGEQVFQERGCPHCHTIGQGPKTGPDLRGVGRRYDTATLELWLTDPEVIYRQTGRRPQNAGFPPMPRISLSRQEIQDLVTFLRRQ
ncbi:MAG: cytochrome c [Acidobacteria bacterium]|nr:cytochrome c [Acidobacteriota bacterium]MDW7983124.1 cytochrome c [Acidobacteriota bacterium]